MNKYRGDSAKMMMTDMSDQAAGMLDKEDEDSNEHSDEDRKGGD